MNEETNIITNEIIEVSIEDKVYNVAKSTNLLLSVLVFTVIIFNLYKILKNCFKRK